MEKNRDEHGGCGDCGKLVSGTHGHGPGCSMPTAGEPPAMLPQQVAAGNPWGSVPNPD